MPQSPEVLPAQDSIPISDAACLSPPAGPRATETAPLEALCVEAEAGGPPQNVNVQKNQGPYRGGFF